MRAGEEGTVREERDEGPDYGPSGYLPEKATRRARKIVLRAPLGLQWVVAAVAVGVVLVVVAAALLLTRSAGRPGPPFEAVGPATSIGAARYDEQRSVLFVAVSGRVRAFVVPADVVPFYCATSGRLESPDGRVWSLTGRALDGGPSLERHPALVGPDGIVYVDFSHTLPGLEAEETEETTACAPRLRPGDVQRPGSPAGNRQSSRTRGA